MPVLQATNAHGATVPFVPSTSSHAAALPGAHATTTSHALLVALLHLLAPLLTVLHMMQCMLRRAPLSLLCSRTNHCLHRDVHRCEPAKSSRQSQRNAPSLISHTYCTSHGWSRCFAVCMAAAFPAPSLGKLPIHRFRELSGSVSACPTVLHTTTCN